jgi:hypothetical protein
VLSVESILCCRRKTLGLVLATPGCVSAELLGPRDVLRDLVDFSLDSIEGSPLSWQFKSIGFGSDKELLRPREVLRVCEDLSVDSCNSIGFGSDKELLRPRKVFRVGDDLSVDSCNSIGFGSDKELLRTRDVLSVCEDVSVDSPCGRLREEIRSS